MPSFVLLNAQGKIVNVIDAPSLQVANHPDVISAHTRYGVVTALGPIVDIPIGIDWHTSDDGATWHDSRPIPEHQREDPDIQPHPDVTI
jgi:hypothetical protein